MTNAMGYSHDTISVRKERRERLSSAFESTVTDLLARGHAVRFRAHGDSMYPSIRSGEHVCVAPIESGSLRIGDVVLARAARGLTAHRIIRMQPDAVVTRGDNVMQRDSAVHPHSILGRVAHVE